MPLRELGEQGLIRRLRERFYSPSARLGIGDDAAVVDVPTGMSVLYCSDLLAENVHFNRALHPADSLGYKAVAVNVSDIGAMGGVPKFLTLSIALTGDLELSWIDTFLDGMARACEQFEVELVGGDSSAAEQIFIDVSMLGWVESGREIRRNNARAGDFIYVTGVLGGSALGLEYLRASDLKHPSVTRHLYPTPRHRIGRQVADKAHAMIDVSDGLSTDLQHILHESNVSARVDKNLIPAADGANDAQVLHGGEEYELLIMAADLPPQLDGCAITRIGQIIPVGSEPQILLVDGTSESI